MANNGSNFSMSASIYILPKSTGNLILSIIYLSLLITQKHVEHCSETFI